MKNLRQFENLVVEEHSAETFHQPIHQQNYYELLYILDGNGYHVANGHKEPYQSGDLFFVTPKDLHFLEINALTHFAVIKFTDRYILDNNSLNYSNEAVRRNELFGFALSLAGERIRLPEKELTILKNTVEHILVYKGSGSISQFPFVFFQIQSVFSLIRQFWIDTNLGTRKPLKDSMLIYIHRNIYFPEKLLVSNLSFVFSLSEKYFSTFFKNNFGISYRNYIINLKVKIIEDRVKVGRSASQISVELGFTDDSHLAHFFKRNTGKTISEIRKINE